MNQPTLISSVDYILDCITESAFINLMKATGGPKFFYKEDMKVVCDETNNPVCVDEECPIADCVLITFSILCADGKIYERNHAEPLIPREGADLPYIQDRVHNRFRRLCQDYLSNRGV